MNIYKDKEKFNNYRKQCKSAKEDTFSTYILYSSFYQLFKIGKSGNVEKRLKAFQKVIPDIVLIIEINVDVEVALHRVFKHKQHLFLKGFEWFYLSKKDIEIVRVLKSLIENND